MTAREIGAWLTAAAGLVTGGGSLLLDNRDLSICEANYNGLMETHKSVVIHLVEETQ